MGVLWQLSSRIPLKLRLEKNVKKALKNHHYEKVTHEKRPLMTLFPPLGARVTFVVLLNKGGWDGIKLSQIKMGFTVEDLSRVRNVLLHVIPKEGVILRTRSVVQLHRISPGNQFAPEVNIALRISEICRWVQTHNPA